MSSIVDDVMADSSFNWKRFAHAFVSTIALAIAIVLAIWIINYFNEFLKMEILTGITDFLVAYGVIIVGMVLLFSVWEYIYPLYKVKLRYVKPLIDAIGLTFGLWIVSVILLGLTVFVGGYPELAPWLSFLNALVLEQFIYIFLLFLFVSYAKFLLNDR